MLTMLAKVEEPAELETETARTSRLLRSVTVAPVETLTAKIRSRLERRYVELVPRHIRELAEANDLPRPNRYVPAAQAEPIIYAEDVRVYAGLESFYSEPPANGDGAGDDDVTRKDGSLEEESATSV